jgi:vancomycin resistance protein VanW
MYSKELKTEIKQLLQDYLKPSRKALSSNFPFLKKPIIATRRTITKIKNLLNPKISFTNSKDYFEWVVARHQSLLRRKLGNSDMRLQEQKITNLAQAVKKLDGTIIPPGNIFSLWTIVGQPKYKNGYVDGMLLSNGQVVEGLGGGLCQLSNLLYWLYLHGPFHVVQRYHHSKDVFPDSGRTLPFGSGATILYNFVDLKLQNTSTEPIQLKIWLSDNHLKAQLLSPNPIPQKYSIFEQDHTFVQHGQAFFRYNKIYRHTKIEGKIISTELLATNFAPVLYDVTPDYLAQNNYNLLKI